MLQVVVAVLVNLAAMELVVSITVAVVQVVVAVGCHLILVEQLLGMAVVVEVVLT
jgi:hypothetical protein